MSFKTYLKNIAGIYSVYSAVLNNPYKTPKLKILIVGVYLANKKNLVRHIIDELSSSKLHEVTQHWIGIGGLPSNERVRKFTKKTIYDKCAKFILINEAIAQYEEVFDYYIICDDDVNLPSGFLDYYISVQYELDFALAQPARTKWSHFDWPFIISKKMILARQTRFVEIGPIFSFNKELKKILMPFDEISPMGWGYDLVWPLIVEENNLKMGVVDSVPVNHTLRPQSSAYSADATRKEMQAYLSLTKHLSKEDAMVNLTIYEIIK